MRKIQFFAFSAAAALTLSMTTSCQKELEQAPASSSETFTVCFTLSEPDTKTAMGETVGGKITNVWSDDDGDRMTFYQNGTASTKVEISSSDNFKHASFTATFPSATAGSYKYKALLAAKKVGDLPVVPAEQHPTDKSFDPNANVLVGLETEGFTEQQSSVNLVYKHAAAISRVCFTGIPNDLTIYGVQINAANAIAGAAKSVDYTDGIVDFSDASEKTISLIYDVAPSSSDGKFDAYFVAIPGTDVQINDIKLFTDKGTFVKNNSKSSKTDFNANKLKSVNVNSPSLVSSEKCYVKVTSAPTDWSGTYLIVDESARKAFDEKASSYASNVTISDGKIAWSETVAKYEVTVSPSSVSGMYELKTVNGKYMYSFNNGSTTLNDNNTQNGNTYYNSLSISGGNVTMYSTRTGTSSPSVNYFGYASNTFGYKKDATTRTVQLYKLQEGATPPLNQTLSFDQLNPSIDIAKQTTFLQEVEGAKTSVTYSISAIPSDAATIDATTGQVTATEECTATITATAAASNMYQGASKSYTLTVMNSSKKYYRKVSIDNLSELTSGTYLLQYSSTNNKYVFDASNSQNNYRTTVTISDEKIESSTSVANAQVTFEAVLGSNNKFYVHTSAEYLGISSSNSIKFSDTKTEFTLTLSDGQISLKTGNYNLYYGSSKFSYNYSSAAKFDLYLLDGSKKASRNLAFAESSVSKNLGADAFINTLDGYADGVTFTSTNTNVATVNSTTGQVTVSSSNAGTTTITASAPETETYRAGSATFTLTVIDPTAITSYKKVSSVTSGKTYLVVDKNNGSALMYCSNNSTNNKMGVTPKDGIITATSPDTYVYCEFVITADGGNYTFYSGKNNKYLGWFSGNNAYLGFFESDSTDNPITFTLPKGNNATTEGYLYFKSTKSGSKSGGSYNEWLYYNSSSTCFKIGGSGNPDSDDKTKTDQGVILYEKQ